MSSLRSTDVIALSDDIRSKYKRFKVQTLRSTDVIPQRDDIRKPLKGMTSVTPQSKPLNNH